MELPGRKGVDRRSSRRFHGSGLGTHEGETASGKLRCSFFLSTNHCQKGSHCPFEHDSTVTGPEQRALTYIVEDRMANNGKGKGSRPCFSMQNNGECKRGDTCQFNHHISIMGKGNPSEAPTKANGE